MGDLFKTSSGQVLLAMTLVINISMLSALIWLTVQLRLERDSEIIRMHIHVDSLGGHELLFDQNVSADVLIPHDNITLQNISAKQIRISSPSISEKCAASILLENDSILIQAESFRSDASVRPEFKLTRRLKKLESQSGITDIKTIRGLSPNESYKNSNHNVTSNLEIRSSDELELSGNMGLRIHSREMHAKSPKSILIESKDESISLVSEKGVRLPDVPRKIECSTGTPKAANLPDVGNQIGHQITSQQVFISRDDGLVSLGPRHF